MRSPRLPASIGHPNKTSRRGEKTA